MSSRESFYVLSSKRLAGDIISLFCPFLDHRCGGVGLHKEMNVNTEIHDDLKYHYFWPIKFVVSGLLFYGLENGLFFDNHFLQQKLLDLGSLRWQDFWIMTTILSNRIWQRSR